MTSMPNTPTATARVPQAARSRTAIVLFEAEAFADRTTTLPRATDVAAFVGAFVAAEGSFTISGEPSSFTFAVGLGALDRGMCQLVQELLGVGHITRFARRKPHYDDEAAIVVRALPELIDVVVPFMDEHLPQSYKRVQYEAWRAALLEYWEHHAKRVRPCTIEGCGRPRRAKELCRSHYYDAYRQ